MTIPPRARARPYGTRRTSLPKKSRPAITSCALAASASSNVRPTTPQAPVVDHVHHGGKAAATPAATAHQGQRTGLKQAEIERDLASRGRARDDEPTSRLDAREALVPDRRADAIEDDVHTAAVGQLLDALAELRRGRVVDHLVGAELLGLFELPVAACRDDGARADGLGHQEPEAPHATADRLD